MTLCLTVRGKTLLMPANQDKALTPLHELTEAQAPVSPKPQSVEFIETNGQELSSKTQIANFTGSSKEVSPMISPNLAKPPSWHAFIHSILFRYNKRITRKSSQADH